MNFTHDTDSTIVLKHCRPLLLPVYEALETSIPLAHTLIEHHGWRYSPQLFSHLVRADVKKTLDGRACPVEYDDTERIMQMNAVSMEGLATTFDGIDFKILKGDLLPPPLSEARERFYQHSQRFLYRDNEIPKVESLVVLWECDLEGNNLRLYLVCPKDGTGRWLWRELIPPPAGWMIVQSSTTPPSGDSDLDISKDEPGEKQN